MSSEDSSSVDMIANDMPSNNLDVADRIDRMVEDGGRKKTYVKEFMAAERKQAIE
jgi:hypothetical protein